jgi:8-oxo-dGTP pyrophosphatase MutT (NUDIX family)
VERDGNGWVECLQGHRHWGRHGAAGLLLHSVDDEGALRVLMQHRADWCHHGGTWGLPGGARDSHETVAEAALREAHEETAVDVSRVRVRHTYVDDHGGWSYTTVYADSAEPLPTTPNEESASLQWIAAEDIAELPLHPGFGSTWPMVRLPAVQLVVDSANVVGSVPDGWWNDRMSAAERLGGRLAALVPTTLDDDTASGVVTAAHLVVEGAARGAAAPAPVIVVEAPHSGDDAITDLVGRLHMGGASVLAVTSDRALRARIRAATDGRAHVRGAGWLLRVLDAN